MQPFMLLSKGGWEASCANVRTQGWANLALAAVCGSGAAVSATTAAPTNHLPPGRDLKTISGRVGGLPVHVATSHLESPTGAMRCTGAQPGLCQGRVVWSWGVGCSRWLSWVAQLVAWWYPAFG